MSSNVLSYPFRDELELDYHGLVQWVAKKAEVSRQLVDGGTTFEIEHELQKLLFVQLWDKLSPEQRLTVLYRVDPHGNIKDKASVAALGGAGALAILSTTVAAYGFAFYTTMSVTIATVASAIGVTVPFAGYMGASSLVGVLSGPVGWAIMGVTAIGGIVILGRPNIQKTTALIGQVHSLKIEALAAARISESEVFGLHR